MRYKDRLGFALLAVAVLLACKSKGNSGSSDNSSPIQNGENFSGRYRSTWGDSTFSQAGSVVSVTYGRGTMSCNAAGPVLDCAWVEGSLVGKALLTKQADRSIRGTWGNGASATNGGQWNFVPLDGGGSAAPAGDVDFGGVYRSTYGDTTFTQTGAAVNARYPGGTMTCTAAGSDLDCTWREGSSSFGRAHLTKQANGDISGSWGNGGSDRNGGQWLFRKK